MLVAMGSEGTLAADARVAVIAAMVPELRPVVRRLGLRSHDLDGLRAYHGRAHGPGHDRWVVATVTSMGTAAATDVTNRLLDAHPVDHVIVVGVCGAIGPTASIGDLVVPEMVVDEATRDEVRPVVLGPHTASGRLLTTDVLHTAPEEIAELAAAGFIAVDMETHAIGRVATDRGIAWSAFRAVSDRAGDPRVDAEVVGLAKADGSANPAAIARFLITRPHRVPKLATLGQGLNRAVAASTRAALAAIHPAG